MERSVGLHMRYRGSFSDLAHKAIDYQLPLFQFFLVEKPGGQFIEPSIEDVKNFCSLRSLFSGPLFVHGSYWINLAALHHNGMAACRRELDLAERLTCDYLVIHPGTAKGCFSVSEGIDLLARAINTIATLYQGPVKMVLENVPHAGLSVGGSLDDFRFLLEKVNNPEQLFFCIDTAHAYVWGYDLATAEGRDFFLRSCAATIGIDKIVLIHLNDSSEIFGSRQDKHAAIGKGYIGQEALRSFVLDSRMINIPIIMEPPELADSEVRSLLSVVERWHKAL